MSLEQLVDGRDKPGHYDSADALLFRHCEEQSDKAIQSIT
jgi:hypothetical protein